MNIIKQLVTGLVTLAIIAIAIPTPSYAVESIIPRNSQRTVSGVDSATTTALHASLATTLSGEPPLAQLLNRLFVMIGQQCTATTTDAQIKTGAGQLGTYWIADHAVGDMTIDLYDGTTTGTISNKIGKSYVASTTAAEGQTRWGGEFATGAYLDITGAGTAVVCYR